MMVLELLEPNNEDLDSIHCGNEDERHPQHIWTSAPWSVGNGDYNETDYSCPGHGLVTVSWSELDAFRQCPKKHDLGYLQRWQKDVEDTTALGRGTLWHRVMEVHYNTIMSHQQPYPGPSQRVQWDCTYEELEQECIDAVGKLLVQLEVDEERDADVIMLLRWMYVGYLEAYGLDEHWDVIAVENTAVVPLYEADGSESWIRLKVKLDLLVRDHKGRYWLLDHKSCGSLPGDKDFDWADQFGLYVYALGKLGVAVSGSIHSAARTKMNKGDILSPGDEGYKSTMKAQKLEERFDRKYMNYTPAQLGGIATDALADFKLAYSEHNHKRRNPNEDWCKWRCAYTEACMFGRRTGSDANLLDMLQRTGFTQNFTRH